MFIVLLSAVDELELTLLSISAKLILFSLFGFAIWVLYKCIFAMWDLESNTDIPQKETSDFQTYQSKEIEELKKKYDKMDEKPVFYFDPCSDHVYLCKNGEKAPVGDIRYLQ